MKSPKPKTDKLYRVFRGGSWFFTTVTVVRAAFRKDFTRLNRSINIGFRCSQTVCRQQVLKGK